MADNSLLYYNSFSLKLIIDKRANKVLCAEAGKDFVDFLFNFLTMPLGSVFRLLKDQLPAPGCVRELAASIENLSQHCFQDFQTKDYLVTKLRGETHVAKVPLLPVSPNRSLKRTIYCCSDKLHSPPRCAQVSSSGRSPRRCSCSLQVSFTDTMGWCREADFVKGEQRYLVKDDLSVLHFDYSIMSGLSLLPTEFSVKDFGVVEERSVRIGLNEGLELLKAFMHNKSALTTVFLGKKETIVDKSSN
ncbi:unnamed protein product [Linum tenue]|uniref:DUF674 family protein n=1 Tax=Linum tenue TaxID=586396 RepID=A0AAV0JQ91_9ROSI|nr:unnamed protein product [Linum tenue]